MSGYWPRPDDGLDTAPYQQDTFDTGVFARTVPEGLDGNWDFENDLTQLLQSAAPDPAAAAIPRQRGARRRPGRLVRCAHWIRARRAPAQAPWLKVLSLFIAALTAAIVGMLNMLGALISYDPLRRLASPGAHGLAAWWPLLVYGPWLVACLSILRAALHRRCATHSWVVVLFFSAVAVCLCVAHAPRTPIGMAVAGLPPVTALLSFQQLVRQITLTHPPRHAQPRQRHGRGRNPA